MEIGTAITPAPEGFLLGAMEAAPLAPDTTTITEKVLTLQVQKDMNMEPLIITLSVAELDALIIKSHNGDDNATETIFRQYMRLPDLIIERDKEIAKSIKDKNESVADCISEGYLGILEGIRRYDIAHATQKGYDLTKWLVWWVKTSIEEYLTPGITAKKMAELR